MSVLLEFSRNPFGKTIKYLERISKKDAILRVLERGGQQGVIALSGATPVRTGLAASSWDYEIRSTPEGYTLTWYNTDIEGGASVVLLIQYGHGTGTGGWVEGLDFINPAMRPVFDQIVLDIRREAQP